MEGSPAAASNAESRSPSAVYAWYVVGVLTLANISGFIDRQILSLLFEPIRRDLGLSLTQMGVLMGLPFALFFTVMGLPLARLADAWSRRAVIGIGIALWSVMTALSGLAGTYGRLLLARVGVGVGEASLQAPAISLIAAYFPPERRGTAQGVYATGVFLGSGLAYFLGGWIVGLASEQDMWTLPLVRDVRPWQTVFFVVGLPGLLIAALMWTVREPEHSNARGVAPLSEVWRWVRSNSAVVSLYAAGFAASATVNYAIAAWMNPWMVSSLDYSAARAGMVQGLLTMSVGTLAVVMGGRLSDWLRRRSTDESAVTVGVIGAVGMLAFGLAAFLGASASSVVALLAGVNFFAALPWGAAQAGMSSLVPDAIRAQGIALFVLVVNLIAFTLGPLSVGWITDTFFDKNVAFVGTSVSIVIGSGMPLAIALLLGARAAARRRRVA